VTALDPAGLLPDYTPVGDLENRITVRAWNALERHNERALAGTTHWPLLLHVSDIRELGTNLRRAIQDDVAVRVILAAIRTDWRPPSPPAWASPPRPDLSPGVAADAEPVEENERLRAEYTVARQQLDDALAKLEHVRTSRGDLLGLLNAAELRATVAEAKLAALTEAAERVSNSAALRDLCAVLDAQAVKP
jgi:hypothetical protein